MSNIEWQEVWKLDPPERSLKEFCDRYDVTPATGNKILVFVDRAAVHSMNEHLNHDKTREHGGVLVGQPFMDSEDGRLFLVVSSALPAVQSQGSPVHLQFTPQAWAHISDAIDKRHPDMAVVGWYHSHPDLGVFMSSTDRATQNAFFNHPWSIATVIDPVRRETAWFAGRECDRLDSGQVVLFGESFKSTPSSAFGGEDRLGAECVREESQLLFWAAWAIPIIGIAIAVVAGTRWLIRECRFRPKVS